jgi:hypothetical protein
MLNPAVNPDLLGREEIHVIGTPRNSWVLGALPVLVLVILDTLAEVHLRSISISTTAIDCCWPYKPVSEVATSFRFPQDGSLDSSLLDLWFRVLSGSLRGLETAAAVASCCGSWDGVEGSFPFLWLRSFIKELA